MSCCRHCQGLDSLFDDKTAQNELKAYQKKGPSKTTQMLVNALKSEGIAGMSLLDIGGGVGAIQHELLNAGAGSSLHVDASASYLEASKQEAKRLGHADNAGYAFGNFVDLAPEIQPADIVTLDRVICCYPDMPALVELSSTRAKSFYAVVYPRDTWWMKLGMAAINFGSWLLRKPYRFFVHPTTAVEAIVKNNGFNQLSRQKTFIWQVVVYKR